MQVYKSDKIRNICLAAHGGVGKTSLADALAFVAGANDRLGKVDEGSSVFDIMSDEMERKLSITSKVFPLEWQGMKINLIDTPGYADFYGQVVSSLCVVEQAALLVCGVNGVEVGTGKVWMDLEERQMPTLVVVNRMDKERASFSGALASLRKAFTANFVPLQLPIGEGTSYKGMIDVLQNKAYLCAGGKITETDVPADMADEVAAAREAIIESAAEGDDALMEKYFEKGALSDEEVARGLKEAVRKRSMIPVFCTAATEGSGVQPLLDFIVAYGVGPETHPGFPVLDGEEKIGHDPAGGALALVFKVTVEQHVGELNFIRLVRGTLTPGMDIMNSGRQNKERVGQMLAMRGRNKDEIKELHAGDMAALVKLKGTKINDTLSAKGAVVLQPIAFPQPLVSIAVSPKSKGDTEKLSQGLSSFMQEDPTFKMEFRPEFSETMVTGMGELQIQMKLDQLKKKYKVEVDTAKPKVSYRETIKSKGDSKYRHKKQSGGAGQFAEVWMRIEPLPRSSGLEFTNSLVGQNVDRVFVPSVEKGVNRAAKEGIFAGYLVTDLKVDFYDGKMHPVDSKDVAFQTAGYNAFKEAFMKAKPVLLEPIMELDIMVDTEFTGDVISDINSRRGKMLGMDSARGMFQTIHAQIPDAELYKYATDLRSLTQGKGTYTIKFSHYEEVPHEMAQKVVAESRKEDEA